MHFPTTDESSPRTAHAPLTIALLGAGGHGRSHLRAIQELAAGPDGAPGRVELVAIADPSPPPGVDALLPAERVFRDATDLFAAHSPDITIICTPINTHGDLAEMAFDAGSHVLLEKPPTPSLDDFERLLKSAARSGLACQVGFQSIGSLALGRLRELVTSGELGTVRGIGGVGTWLRHESYWQRARWAGRRSLDGIPVVDGVVTNPLAHAVATALAADGSTRAGDVESVEVDLFHANRIEADDTSSVRIRTRSGTTIALGLTLCATAQTPPRIVVHGSRTTATLYYTTDVLELRATEGGGLPITTQHGRTPLLANLVDHITDGTALVCPLEETGAFMRVLDEVRAAPAPREIAPVHLRTEFPPEPPHSPHIVVQDVETWCERVADELETFSGLGAPWTVPDEPREHRTLAALHVGPVEVATYVDGSGARPTDSPRPHLHPVRTLGGVLVSDSAPADHTWHAGVGMGVQDVDGHNLWGGRTYVRDQGYTWRQDHGTIEHDGWAVQGDRSWTENLTWRGHDGQPLLRERRTVRWWGVRAGAWALELRTILSVDPAAGDERAGAGSPVRPREVRLGSPGAHGRAGGGYGGFFWRVAPCTDVRVWSPDAEGEDAVHGRPAPWVAFGARSPEGDPFTLLVVAADDGAAADPWVVRAASYPGVGSAIAWDTPTVVAAGAPLVRAFRVGVVDGEASPEGVESLLRAMDRTRRTL